MDVKQWFCALAGGDDVADEELYSVDVDCGSGQGSVNHEQRTRCAGERVGVRLGRADEESWFTVALRLVPGRGFDEQPDAVRVTGEPGQGVEAALLDRRE